MAIVFDSQRFVKQCHRSYVVATLALVKISCQHSIVLLGNQD